MFKPPKIKNADFLENGLKIKYYIIITMNSKRSMMICSVKKTLSF